MKSKTSWSMLILLYVVLVTAPALISQSNSERKRPNKHPYFSDGFRAFRQENWKEAADYMEAALSDWHEDGELTRVYGRWFEPYLPRYYLGAALAELGCYRAAQHQLDETILNRQEIKGAKNQKQQLALLKLENEEFLRQGIEAANDECGKWDDDENGQKGNESDV